MKKFIAATALYLLIIGICSGQYNTAGTVISGGINTSRYLGSGEGGNHFDFSNPGFQLELTANSGKGFEWIVYGVAYYSTFNYAGNSKVPVQFWTPYYTEFLYYQKAKKNPLFFFFGYDYVRMKFPDMEKPDSHYNLTLGAGWNLKLSDKLYLQFKAKPYFVFGNSIGQRIGINGLVNLHLNLSKRRDS